MLGKQSAVKSASNQRRSIERCRSPDQHGRGGGKALGARSGFHPLSDGRRLQGGRRASVISAVRGARHHSDKQHPQLPWHSRRTRVSRGSSMISIAKTRCGRGPKPIAGASAAAFAISAGRARRPEILSRPHSPYPRVLEVPSTAGSRHSRPDEHAGGRRSRLRSNDISDHRR